jgi:hypothetical protein
MKEDTHFSQVLDNIDQLSVEEQETLLQVVRNRLIDRRRKEIIQETQEAENDFKQGKASPATPEALMKEILS